MSLDFVQNKSKFHSNQDGERNKNEHRSEEYYFRFEASLGKQADR